MDYWFISDTHFGHANIIKYSNRPFNNVDDMNEHMVQEWNNRVKKDDVVYHLGDFAFMKWESFKLLLPRLNGNIHVILGNHDKMISENSSFLESQGKIVSIRNYRDIKLFGKTLVLFHYGQRVWNKSHYGSIHLYGHSHGSLPPFGKSVDVGVDCKEITSEYRPIHFDEIVAYMDKREIVNASY